MKLRNSKFDDLLYVIAVVITFGGILLIRAVITRAIKRALDDGKESR